MTQDEWFATHGAFLDSLDELSCQRAAHRLNAARIPTPTGGNHWHGMSVYRVRERRMMSEIVPTLRDHLSAAFGELDANDKLLREHILGLAITAHMLNMRIIVAGVQPTPDEVEKHERLLQQLRLALEAMAVATDSAFDLEPLFRLLGNWDDVGETARERAGMTRKRAGARRQAQ